MFCIDILPDNQEDCQHLYTDDPKNCIHLKPLSVARLQTFANNSLYFTRRSRLMGDDYIFLPDESRLIKSKVSKRHNRYRDNTEQQRKNELDKYRACLAWLVDIELELGWHKCPVPKFFSEYKDEIYLVFPDGRVTIWAKVRGQEQQVATSTIEELKKRCNARLDIIRKVQQTSTEVKNFSEGYKNTVFGRNARRTLLEAGEVVNKTCGLNSYVVTLTLPGNTSKAKKALANYSSYILNRLLQVPRRVKKPVYLFSVWELQKRGALHLHISVSAKPDDLTSKELELICHKIKDKWYQVLMEMITTVSIKRGNREGNYPGVDMFEKNTSTVNRHDTWRYRPDVWVKGWDIQKIEKSVGKYFAKYASKDAKAGNGFAVVKSNVPSRWWCCNSIIREEIKKYRYDYSVGYHEIETHDLLNSVFEAYPPIMNYEYDFHITTKQYKIDDNNILDLSSEVEVTVVNGITEIYYWEPDVFPEVCQLIRELKGTFSEIGFYREPKTVDRLYTPMLA